MNHVSKARLPRNVHIQVEPLDLALATKSRLEATKHEGSFATASKSDHDAREGVLQRNERSRGKGLSPPAAFAILCSRNAHRRSRET